MTLHSRFFLAVLAALVAFPPFAGAKDQPGAPHMLIVEGGTGGGTHTTEEKVTVAAEPPPPGKFFDHWGAPDALKLRKADFSSFVLEMPDADVTLKANYADVAASPRIRVACVGDSITEITGYPRALGELLPKDQYDVRNFGVSSSTTLFKGPKPYYKESAFRAAKDFKPNVVVVLLGTNDTRRGNANTYQHIADFIPNYRQIVTELAGVETKPKVYIGLPTPIYGEGNFGLNEENLEAGVIPGIKAVAEEMKLSVIDLHAALSDHPEYFKDRIHPGGDGPKLMARVVYTALTGKEPPAIPSKSGSKANNAPAKPAPAPAKPAPAKPASAPEPAVPSPRSAVDPRNPTHSFQYTLYPPEGFSVKKSKAVVWPDPAQPKTHPLVGKDGKFTELGQWYYDIGSDPKNFEAWWRGYFTDPAVWKPGKTPVWDGTMAGNQGHRIIAWLGTMKMLLDRDDRIDPAVKQAYLSDDWKHAVEQVIGDTVDERGLMHVGDNIGDLACHFHFIRSKFGAMGLRLDHIYTLPRAQALVATMLTEPWTVSPEDRYLDPPSRDYLEAIARQKAGTDFDIRLVKDGKVLWSGGLFAGWKDKPSLHGTWDGLSILNSLFKYYPDPDPASPGSIYYHWNQLPGETKEIAKRMIVLCSRRLWLDWQENKGPTWCWVRDGKATDDDTSPSEAPMLPAYDGYGDNQFGWARSCWEEMFGDPMRNTNDGVQALLAMAHGTVHRNLKTPVGQQVPGRYDYDAETQRRRLQEDLAKLGRPATSRPATDDEGPRLKPEPKNVAPGQN